MLFTHMLDGFALHEMIFDTEGKAVDYRFLAVNPSFEEITGLSAANIVGRTVLEALPGTEPHWIENYGNVVLTGEPLRFESTHARLNKVFDVHAYRPEKGQFACIFRDITDRNAREAKIRAMSEDIRKSSAEYRHIFENAVEGIFRTSTDGRILAANPTFANMLGYDCEQDLVGIATQQLYADPEERSQVQSRLDEQGVVRGYECQARRRDGAMIWVSLSSRKILRPDGETAHMIGFIEDITARKEAEEKLAAGENKFRMAFMTGADASAISTLDDGVVLEVNDRFTDLFGYSREEAIGRTVGQLGCYAESDRQRLQSGLLAHGQVENMEFTARRKNGEVRSVLVSAHLQPGNGRSLLLSVVRDITEQKRAEAERTRLEDQLRQSPEAGEYRPHGRRHRP